MVALYPFVLAVTRWLLPILSLLLVFLWAVGYLRPGKPKTTLARLVSREDFTPYPFTVCESIIGGHKRCDLFIPGEQMEKNHAMLHQEKGQWILTPLEGEVFVNERPAEEPIALLEGDILSFGGEEFLFQCNLSEEFDPPAPKGGTGGWMLTLLTLFQGGMFLQLWCRFGEECSPYLPMGFLGLAVVQWLYFIMDKVCKNGKMLWEIPILYLFTLGLGVCACADSDSLPKQLLCAGAGLVGSILLTLLLRRPRVCFALHIPIALICVGVLWFTVMFGTRIFGSVNWLSVGGISFQPSEFAKVAFLLVGAASVTVVQTHPRNRWFFMIFAGVTMAALVCMVDFGAIAIFFVTMMVLLCMRLTDWRLLVGIVLCALLAGGLAVTLFPHIATRFSAWLHVWELADSAGYQQTRTLIAMASGGLLGVGGGNGTLLSVAAADTDLVFGVLCEEWGQITALCAALCFAAFPLIALRFAKTAGNGYAAMGVCGAAVMMLFQTALNLFGSTDLLPLTGVTMMFVSRGGTSLLAAFLLTAFFKAADRSPTPLETERRVFPQ